MMMSDLPLDLTEEILCRIPAASLIQLRSTCKIWNGLLKDRRFTEKHFHKAPRKSHVLMSTYSDCKLYPMKVDLNVVPPSVEFKDELSLKYSHSNNSKQVGIFSVSHCDDGLLLCTTIDSRLVVWNPCLGETRWIETKTDIKNFYIERFSLGYQNKKSFRSYKILRCCNRDQVVGFEIYEFSSDLWRVFADVALDCSIISYTDVCLKGNPYWLALDETTSNKFVLGFDFTRDRIIRLCLPSVLNREDILLSVFREEQLSLLHWNILTPKISMEIWVTNGINTEVALWSKYLTVELHSRSLACPVLLDITSFIIVEEKKMALCCSLRDFKKRVYFIGEDKDYSTEMPSTIKKIYIDTNYF